VILYGGKPVGMVQSYRIDDYPTHKTMIDLDCRAAGIDIFIGEEDHVNRGLGSLIIRKFLNDIVFANYGVDCCITDPEPENEAAIKAYSKAGFKYVKTVRNHQDNLDAYVMSKSRNETTPQKEDPPAAIL
jgi:RimJ/RimL family protein N-acetyltransferase